MNAGDQAPRGTHEPTTVADSSDEEAMLSAYVDGELEPTQRAAVEERIDACPELGAEVEDLRELLRAMGDLPSVTAPPDFYDKVHRKLRRRHLMGEHLWAGLSSLPFQLVSIFVVILIAAVYMMLQLDLEHARLERDPTAATPRESDSTEHSGRAAAPPELR